MFNKLFSKDDPAALAYEAAQRAAAGYEDEARMIKHEPSLAETINKFVHRFSERRGQRSADAWMGVRQLPGALRRWWHERLQPDMQAGDERVKQPLFISEKGKG